MGGGSHTHHAHVRRIVAVLLFALLSTHPPATAHHHYTLKHGMTFNPMSFSSLKSLRSNLSRLSLEIKQVEENLSRLEDDICEGNWAEREVESGNVEGIANFLRNMKDFGGLHEWEGAESRVRSAESEFFTKKKTLDRWSKRELEGRNRLSDLGEEIEELEAKLEACRKEKCATIKTNKEAARAIRRAKRDMKGSESCLNTERAKLVRERDKVIDRVKESSRDFDWASAPRAAGIEKGEKETEEEAEAEAVARVGGTGSLDEGDIVGGMMIEISRLQKKRERFGARKEEVQELIRTKEQEGANGV